MRHYFLKLFMFVIIALQSGSKTCAQTYSTLRTNIIQNGSPWVKGGVNAFDQFGTSSKGNYGVGVVREVVVDMSECPITLSDGTIGTSIGTLHSLQEVINNNRAQGQVTILSMFGWDTGSHTQILGVVPDQTSYWTAYQSRLAAIATAFKGQSDVWIDPWNEPVFNNSVSTWSSNVTVMYNIIRSTGNNNVILIPCDNYDSNQADFVNGSAFLGGKTNLAATLHCYAYWTEWAGTAYDQSLVTSKINSVRNAGWPLVIGECGGASSGSLTTADYDACKPFLQTTLDMHVPTVGWAWNSTDDLKLQNGSLTYWGNVFMPFVALYTPAVSTETPYGGKLWAVPGKIEAENYDDGGEGVGYHDLDAANQGGAYRSDGVDIEATSDTSGAYDVGWCNAGEWLKYMVNVTSAGNYKVSFRVSSGAGGGRFHLEDENGTNLTGTVTVPGTGGWQTWVTVNATIPNLTAGSHTLKLAEDSSSYNINTITFTQVVPIPPVPTGLSLKAGNAQVSLSWNASSGASSYKVYRSTASGTETLLTSGINTSSYVDTSLKNGTKYYYKVAAVSSGGTSALSSQKTITPSATILVNNGAYTLLCRDNSLSADMTNTSSGTSNPALAKSTATYSRWNITNLGGNVVTIVNTNGSQALAANNSVTAAPGQVLYALTYDPSNTAEQWKVSVPSAGYYTFMNVWSGLVIDTASNTSGAALIQTTGNGTNGQQWSFHQ